MYIPLPPFHRSPLHELFHCFPDLRQVETASHTLSSTYAGELPFELVVADTKEEAKSRATEVLRSRDTCIFTHGYVSDSKIGAAAVAVRHDSGCISRRVSLGPAALWQVHDGILTVMTLALCVTIGCPRATHVSILVPDRAAVTALTSRPDTSLGISAYRGGRCMREWESRAHLT